MRVYLTENCNLNCSWCFNKNIRNPSKDMNTDIAKKLLKWLVGNGVNRILIMGGEPCIHPDFLEICNSIDESVRFDLFTNGSLIDTINKLDRIPNVINYNFHTISPNKNLFTLHSMYVTEIVIKPGINLSSIFDKIEKLVDINHRIKLNITIDCMTNWFLEKELLNKYMDEFLRYIETHSEMYWHFDHSYPACLFIPSTLDRIKYFFNEPLFCLCGTLKDCSGLITSEFKARHCNQYCNEELSIIKEDGEFISFDTLKNFLLFEGFHKLESLRNSSCKDCYRFRRDCNGGCIGHKFIH